MNIWGKAMEDFLLPNASASFCASKKFIPLDFPLLSFTLITSELYKNIVTDFITFYLMQRNIQTLQ